MVVVAVKIPDIALGGSVPLELSSFLLPSQWNLIVTHIQDAHRDATFWSCCIEIAVCVLFVFPCVFLCHPCCSTAFTLENIHRYIHTPYICGIHILYYTLWACITYVIPSHVSYITNVCRKVRTLNILLFGGSAVLSVMDDSILFNTDLIVVCPYYTNYFTP